MSYNIYIKIPLVLIFVVTSLDVVQSEGTLTCFCSNATHPLAVRQSPVVTTFPKHACARFYTKNIFFDRKLWSHVIYQGHNAFVEQKPGQYYITLCTASHQPLTTTTTTTPTTTTTTTLPPTLPPTCSDLETLRQDWGATAQYEQSVGNAPGFNDLPRVVIVDQSGELRCHNQKECTENVKQLERWDRQFNFAVGEDGKVYELHGFQKTGSHSGFFDHLSIGILFMGVFDSEAPADIAMDAAKMLIRCAVDQGALHAQYVIRTEREITGVTHGQALFESVSQWNHHR